MRYFGHHEDREDIIDIRHARLRFWQRNLHRVALVKDPQHRPDQEENQKERKDDHRAQRQRLAAIGHRLAGQYPLHNQLLGAVRRHYHDSSSNHTHPNIERRREQKLRDRNSRRRNHVQPVEFTGFGCFSEYFAGPALHQLRDVAQCENSAQEKQTELRCIRPNDGFDASDIRIKQRQNNEQQYRSQYRVPGSQAEQLVPEHQLHRNTGDIHPHTCRQCLTYQKKAGRGLAGSRSKRVRKQLIRRVNLAFEIVRHEHDGENDARDHVANDHLHESNVAAVGHRRHPDNRQRARFRCDDREPDAPPGDIFAAQEIIAGGVLILPEP